MLTLSTVADGSRPRQRLDPGMRSGSRARAPNPRVIVDTQYHKTQYYAVPVWQGGSDKVDPVNLGTSPPTAVGDRLTAHTHTVRLLGFDFTAPPVDGPRGEVVVHRIFPLARLLDIVYCSTGRPKRLSFR